MKKLFILVYSFFNRLYLTLYVKGLRVKHSELYFTRINSERTNELHFTQSKVQKTFIKIVGNRNKITATHALISNCLITITGSNNELIVSEDVLLRQANIIIRGNNCKITIGRSSSFGGIRVVNVGESNDILIGEQCLFSDNIEIWASDTHSIYDEKGNWINREKPVIIGNNVWVGSKVTILKGVTIGNNSIIGMGSVVVNDVPEKVISGGYPNRIIKNNVHWDIKYPA